MRSILLILLQAISLFVIACSQPTSPISNETGRVHLHVRLAGQGVIALAKASSDSTFTVDSLAVILSSDGQASIEQRISISGSPDSGAVIMGDPIVFSDLAPLRNWKIMIFALGATSPGVFDTTHVDSFSTYIMPGDNETLSVDVRPRYSIIRARIHSSSSSLLPNKILKIRLSVDGITRDSIILNSKIFDHTLIFKRLRVGVSQEILLQAFDNAAGTQGYERSFSISPPQGLDTTIIDSISVISGTARSGSSNKIRFGNSASSIHEFYSGMMVEITSGPGVGQTRMISSYNGGSRTATVSPNWSVSPNSSSGFIVYHRNLLTVCGRSGFPACTL